MPRLVELIGKAICAQQGGDPNGGHIHETGGMRFAIHEWAKYERTALEALRAMRTPTSGQLDAFLKEEDALDDEERRAEIIEIWQGMIDAALSE